MKKRKPDFSKPKPIKKTEEESQSKINNINYDENSNETLDMGAEKKSSQKETNSESKADAKKDSDDYGRIDANAPDEIKFYPDKTYFNLPLVVIAGRPNVGKSTIFNRFMKKRLAITDPTPGVTRDPVEGTAFINGKPVHLMDTGGFKLDRDEGTMEAVMDELVVQKTLEMIKKADVILLLLEAGTITGEDEEFIKILRPYWNKVVAAVNKCEGGKNESVAWNYMKFGFKNLLFISAEHGDHIPELSDEIISRLDFSHVSEGKAQDRPIKIAIMGKPNTGKSTLSNKLTHTEASIVSDYAGTTRDVVEGSFRYNERDFEVLDTAGIRRKAKVKANVEYYSVNRAIKTLDEADVVFLLIDAQEGLAEQDKKICSLAYERGRGIIFVLNKWDTQDQSRETFKKTSEYIKTMFGQMNYAPIIPISAKEGDGIKQLMDTALVLYEQLTKKIETAALNKALQDWLFHYPPPASKAIHFKIRYMTQTGTNPVSFLIFATSPDKVPGSYVTYLKNSIRKDLGYDQIPVILEMKASRTRWENREKPESD